MSDAATIPLGPAKPGAEQSSAIQRMLEKALSRPCRVVSVSRRPSEHATLFPAEQVMVTLADGERITLFVKHAGDEQADHPDKQRRDRETLVYERLLEADPALPAPSYYASHLHPSTGRRSLHLEWLDDWNLRYHALEHWFTAARRLADLHAHFARDPVRLCACDFLLRLDGPYFTAWAERAATALRPACPDLHARLVTLVNAYGAVARCLASQPPTLVHNDLAPKNVVAVRGLSAAAIFFIDWETAGIGCGLLDLVHLKYGLGHEADAAMVEAYRAQAGSLLPAGEREFARLLAACELHKTLYRLAHAPQWALPVQRVAAWVAEAEQFLLRARGDA